MRKLACFLFMSVDGVIESPDQFVHEDLYQDILAIIAMAIEDQDGVLLGRKLYEEWAEYWPGSPIAPFNGFINPVRKYVVSRTLKEVGWTNATLLEGDLATAVRALKSTSGGTLCVHGSVELAQSLLRLGLIDELRLVHFPALAGRGRRLFEAPDGPVHLDLRHSHATPGGLQYLVYGVSP